MRENQELKHICKFCEKSFSCGRSLGGHTRSHLISISSEQTLKKDHNLEKSLPTNDKNNAKIDEIMVFGSRVGSNKARKVSRAVKEVDTSLQRKLCKECGKSFQSWKALLGHMKSHSRSGSTENSVEDDSRDSFDYRRKMIMDSCSDSETATPLCKKKRSDRLKRGTSTVNSSSSYVPDLNQQEEVVALSLIMLSRDARKWDSELLEAKNIGKIRVKKSKTSEFLKSTEMKTLHSRNGLKTRTGFHADDKFKKLKNVSVGCKESEVRSPKNSNKKSELDLLQGQDFKKKKRKFTDSDLTLPVENYRSPFSYNPFEAEDFVKNSKFLCTICKRAFSSYQALGGHRASHKKFKGCCAPRTESAVNSPIRSDRNTDNIGDLSAKTESEFGSQKGKEHECPICFKIFPSGQALGGHKRSHLTKSSHPATAPQKPMPEIRDFLDLNMPAPVDEECSDFKSWWIGICHGQEHDDSRKDELLLGLVSI